VPMTAIPSASQFAGAAPAWRLAPKRIQDAAAVDALVDRAFGPGRFAKTAERLREGNRPRLDLSVCAWAGGELIGAVTLWPIRIGSIPGLFLGPIAVDPAWRKQGLAKIMAEQACEAARASGERLVLLVGDLPLFGPVGFEPMERGRIQLPGPVNPARVLWRPLIEGALDGVFGPVSAAIQG